MKEKKDETEKKRSEKKKFQCGNRTRDLLICSRPSLYTTELPPQGLIARTILTYMANLNGHELRVASLAALTPPITFHAQYHT